jgi:hypothetical protein
MTCNKTEPEDRTPADMLRDVATLVHLAEKLDLNITDGDLYVDEIQPEGILSPDSYYSILLRDDNVKALVQALSLLAKGEGSPKGAQVQTLPSWEGLERETAEAALFCITNLHAMVKGQLFWVPLVHGYHNSDSVESECGAIVRVEKDLDSSDHPDWVDSCFDVEVLQWDNPVDRSLSSCWIDGPSVRVRPPLPRPIPGASGTVELWTTQSKDGGGNPVSTFSSDMYFWMDRGIAVANAVDEDLHLIRVVLKVESATEEAPHD